MVAQYVIEKNLGYNVNLLTIDEIPAWPAMVQGKVSAVLEVWGHSPLYCKYVTGNHQVIDAGLEGPERQHRLVRAHVPDAAASRAEDVEGRAEGLEAVRDAAVVAAGPVPRRLASYVTNDQALVTNLKINLKVVFAGTEAAQLTEIESDYKAKKPVLFYWYTPQYQNAIYKFSQVALPPLTPTCAKLKPAQINCSYPPYPSTR